MRKWNLALMSSPEIAAIAKNEAVLLVPIGCVEQNGPVGYTGVDTMLAEYICHRTAEAVDCAYVTPPVWFGYTPWASFPGTVAFRLGTLRAVVHDLLDAYLSHGFRHVVIVNNHPHNEAAIEPVAVEMRKKYGVVLSLFYPWELAIQAYKELYPDSTGALGHGGEPSASIMMALSPGVIDVNKKAAGGYIDPDGSFHILSSRAARFEGYEIGLYSDPSRILPSGATGDWRVATEDRGHVLLRHLVAYATRLVPAFLKMSQHSGDISAEHPTGRH